METYFEEMLQDTEIRIGKLKLCPGEFLVFQTDLVLSKDQTEAMVAHIRESLPEGVQFMFVSGGMTVSIGFRRLVYKLPFIGRWYFKRLLHRPLPVEPVDRGDVVKRVTPAR
jgi:hypothetical protein